MFPLGGGGVRYRGVGHGVGGRVSEGVGYLVPYPPEPQKRAVRFLVECTIT